MLSRHADACYWIGRYVERAEAAARMVDVHYHAALESGLPPESEFPGETASPMQWKSLLAISGVEEAYFSRYETENDRDIMEFFAFDTTNPNSIVSVWKSARANARAIREQLASEMWESLNISYLETDGMECRPGAFRQSTRIFSGREKRLPLISGYP